MINEQNTNSKEEQNKITSADVEDMRTGSDDEASFDSDYDADADGEVEVNPSKDNNGVKYQRGTVGGQQIVQQEQQQTVTGGDEVARRAGMNSGTQGIGTGSAQGYEGNTDDTGLPQDDLSFTSSDIGEDEEVEDMEMDSSNTDDENLDLSGAGGSDIDDVSDLGRTSGVPAGSKMGQNTTQSRVSDQRIKQTQDVSRRI